MNQSDLTAIFQELIALGAAHVFGSFFLCFPGANALARSLVQDSVGGVTQVNKLPRGASLEPRSGDLNLQYFMFVAVHVFLH